MSIHEKRASRKAVITFEPVAVFTGNDHLICGECYEKTPEQGIADDDGFVFRNKVLGLVAVYKLNVHRCRTCGIEL